jgi:hypothetical protein
VLDVLQRAGLEVVDAEHAVPLAEQVLAQVGAEKPGSAGHDSGRHPEDAIDHPGRIRLFRACLTKCLRRLLQKAQHCVGEGRDSLRLEVVEHVVTIATSLDEVGPGEQAKVLESRASLKFEPVKAGT